MSVRIDDARGRARRDANALLGLGILAGVFVLGFAAARLLPGPPCHESVAPRGVVLECDASAELVIDEGLVSCRCEP